MICVATGVTAAHLLNSSFLGFRGLMGIDCFWVDERECSIACRQAPTEILAPWQIHRSRAVLISCIKSNWHAGVAGQFMIGPF